MANSALIDDLLKQFADNPRRVFARLANEYRKRGELDSAIEICRSHVPLQPGYISGHIVLGQALYDSGSLAEAKNTFETALALDPENLIALRHMGDIARANGDLDGSLSWYRQLLEIDPQNEEVAAQLESLGVTGQTGDSPPSAVSEEMGGWGEVSPEAIDLAMEEGTLPESTPPAGVAVESAAPAGDAAPADDALALEEIFDLPERAEEEDSEAEAPRVPAVEGLESTSVQSEERAEVPPLELVDVGEISSRMADDPESGEVAAEMTPGQIAVAPLFPADSYDFANENSSDDEDATPSAFATETMAELYLQQGFPDRALAIYRELAARAPDDGSLQERIAELTETEDMAPAQAPSARSSRTAREFFGVLAYRRAPHDAGHEAAPVAEVVTELEPEAAAQPADPRADQPVDQPATEAAAYVAAAASAEEPVSDDSAATSPAGVADSASAAAPVEAHGRRPGREAASALSLDDVFRDNPAAAGSGSRKGLSFDEFFARRGNGTSEHTNGTVADDDDENPTGEERASGDEPQDLELFHAWLDGLKG